ncbi:MAG: dihydrofolate reductase [Roseitalea sp.]|jgi:dihydrofolate reductase|nr:dihydrofolate reductase [Roseitalea sp.]MBO6722748.1 dihydrofolate reductase [Roseitalea sp.]MBO6745178.1 dihydrofolate reductase [Roseitalea sp.]
MARFLGYIAMSVDARIADSNQGVEWLDRHAPGDADMGYPEFYGGIDALVMGRTTYDFVAAQPEWPYPGKMSYVVTSRPLTSERDDVTAVEPDFARLRDRVDADGRKNVWIVGGGQTQRAALDAGMFDELRVFVLPVVLGSGPLIFADGAQAGAKLTGHKVWPGGVVELIYAFEG